MEQLNWLQTAKKPNKKASKTARPTKSRQKDWAKKRLLCKRPCVAIGGIRYLLYGSVEQDARIEKTLRGLPVTCEHCGAEVQSWDLFYWRLFGLCSDCHNRAMKEDSIDYVHTKTLGGMRVYMWKKHGGKER